MMSKISQRQDIRQLLLELGFNDKSAQVYLSCLESGISSAPKIAEQNKMGKTTVYSVLRQLVKQGLVEEIIEGKRKKYQANSPALLKNLLNQRQRKLNQILPNFLNIYQTPKFKPKISYYQGYHGVKKVFEDTLNCQAKIVYSFSPLDTVNIFGKTYTVHFINTRVKNGIYNKSLREYSPSYSTRFTNQNWEIFSTDPKLLREMRILPPRVKLDVGIRIYDHKVAVMSFKQEGFAFVMESQELSNFMKTIHQLIWQISEKI